MILNACDSQRWREGTRAQGGSAVALPPNSLRLTRVEPHGGMVLLDTPYQLQDAGPAAVGSSRTYLLETQVLPSVECGIEDMLRACTAAAEAGERVDPINFLATYLMRNNPRHSGRRWSA